MKILSVIVVTYKSRSYIKKCLDSIFFYNDIGDNLEIIIVDNSPENIALEMNEYLQFEYGNKILFIQTSKNGGYGYGNNIGINSAKGNYIAIMNPDIIMTQPLFADAVNQLKVNNNIGMLGYKQFGGHDLSFYLRQEFYFPIFTPILTKICNRIDIFNQNYMYLSGAYFFAKKETFEFIGNFDENIFLYCEESDITKRFLQRGFSIKYDSSKSYIHEISDRKEMSSSGFKFLLDSTMYYLDKFSFSNHKFLFMLQVDLKFKILVFNIVNNLERKTAIKNQLKELINLKKNFL